MRIHSKLRIPINRDLGFRVPIADAQPFGIRALSPAPRNLPILPPLVDLKLLGFSESKCRWTRRLPNRSEGLFDVPTHTRGLPNRAAGLSMCRCTADPHKPSVGLFDVPMHTRGLPYRAAGLSMCRCTRGPPQTIHRPFRCANALADSQTVLQDFRCADALADPHKPSIGVFDAPMHSRAPNRSVAQRSTAPPCLLTWGDREFRRC